jgi:hypothetical protein
MEKKPLKKERFSCTDLPLFEENKEEYAQLATREMGKVMDSLAKK